MSQKIRIGIVGYGNIGKGVEMAISQNSDMELAAIFTRRNPTEIKAGCPVFAIDEAKKHQGKIDVMILCGGSATDLPDQGPFFAGMFNTVDSFDTHARIPEYFSNVDSAAKEARTLAIISTGWDPGLFSLTRVLGESILPQGQSYTFWGPGISQGHSDAIRRVKGVSNGKQYTIPVENALARVRAGDNPQLSTREKHTRVCYIVPEDGADLAQIEREIKTMPNYFSDYDTTVHFISRELFENEHSAMPHGGFVLRSGKCADGTNQLVEFSLKLESNPNFTANVMVAYARAIYRMHQEGKTGALSVLDIPVSALSQRSSEELRKEML